MKLKVFVGPKFSGKDTCAKILQNWGITADKIPFAGPLKKICCGVWGPPLHTFEDAYFKELLQHFEMEVADIYDLFELSNRYVTPESETAFLEHLKQFEGMEFISRRDLLQKVGTEILRSFDPGWHCKAAFSPQHLMEIKALPFKFERETFSVTDCRFINEYEYLKANHDCEFFYVERPEAEAALALATHQSELEIIKVKERLIADGGTVIYNDAGLEELEGTMHDIVYGEQK